MEKKPANGKMPAIARQLTKNVPAVTGIFSLRPPMVRMSWLWWQASMTAPEPRNRQALKNAWVTRWNTAATQAPMPAARNMKPSWLTVE